MNIELYDDSIQIDNGIRTPGNTAQLLTVTAMGDRHAGFCIETRTVDHRPGGEVTFGSAQIKLDEAGLRSLADWLRRRGY